MRSYVTIAALIAAAFLGGAEGACAQSAMLNLPRASQHARITQRIGITDITIDYSRPLVGGRKMLLLPYGQVWRAGANENTTIQFSDPVTVEGQHLAKGVYGLHMIPNADSWIVIFSKNSTSWGSFTYDKSEDALRVTIKPNATGSKEEALTYNFDDLTQDSATITMRWANLAIPFKVEVNTPEIVAESLRKQLRSRVQFEWQPWVEAANYLMDNKLSAEEALKCTENAIGNEDRFEAEITKARALTLLGRKDEAAAAHDRAIALGTQLQVQTFARGLQREGRQEEALELFRINIKKDPNSWIAHNEASRLAVASGDFDTAVKEMKLALARSPESLKSPHSELIRLLENKVDINK
ncbi:MAG TPA: DUF2911 domain-containing protein [Blastocatellia bacterium]|nr:DUF2911 domain-containing protein [Blastocatellia bacterium]